MRGLMIATSVTTQDTAPRGTRDDEFSLGALARRNKRISLAVLAGVVVLAAVVVLGAVGAGGWKVSDATTCSAWSSANQTQQSDYAALYVREHGPVATAGGVIAAINAGCTQAFGYDEADTVTVLKAIRKQY